MGVIESVTGGCERVRELISAEVDSAASPDEVIEIARHVARCGACAAARADFLSADRALAEASAAIGKPGPDAWAAVERHMAIGAAHADPAAAAKPRGRTWFRTLRAAAAVTLALGAGFALGRLTAPDAPPAASLAPSPEDEALRAAAVLDGFFSSDLNEWVSDAAAESERRTLERASPGRPRSN